LKPANIYIFALIIVALTMVVVLAISFGLDYYTAEVLRWSPHEQRLILFSGGAVLWAILLLLWVRAAEKKTPEENESDLPVSSIIDMAGWTMLCLALTFSEAHKDWHIAREFYFGLGLLSGLTIVYSYIFKYQRTKKQAEKKASLIGLVYLILPALVIWKYATGDQNLF